MPHATLVAVMEGTDNKSSQRGGTSMNVPLFMTAAHELKSPLALVRQLSLTLENVDHSPAEIEKIAHQITLTSERALRLTTDLTKTSRLEDSLFTLEPLNPASLCESVVEELAPLYRAKGKNISFRSRQRTLLALANKDLLRRILLNFADNALHYSADDMPVVVSAQLREKGSRIRLSVRDFGPALPKNVWGFTARSLGPTAQTLHARPESSGLGIYIAHQFAEAMSARVGTVRHRDGATFYVDIAASTQLRLF